MYDLISIGNIAIDLFYKGMSITTEGNRFQLAVGGKYFADYLYESLGGGGANVAIGIQKHGLRSAVLAKIGNNSFKKIIIDKLQEECVSYQLCQFESDYLNISSILLDDLGEKTILNYQTPHQHIFETEKEYEKLKRGKAVYIGNMPDVYLTEKANILKFLKHNNIRTFVNLGVHDCRRSNDQLDHLLSNVETLIVNGHEFADLVKTPYEQILFKKNIIRTYLPQFMNKLFVITDGEKGSYAYQGDHIFYQPAIAPKKIVDSTGAGDGYTAAFISEYLQSNNISQSMQKASQYASKILGKIGAN